MRKAILLTAIFLTGITQAQQQIKMIPKDDKPVFDLSSSNPKIVSLIKTMDERKPYQKDNELELGNSTSLSKHNLEKSLFKTGNEGGGGGNVCILGHRAPVLLELAPKEASEYYAQGAPGEILQKTKFLSEAGITNLTESLEAGSSPLYTPRLKEEVRHILSTSLVSSPITTALILKFLENIHFFGVDTKINESFGADYSETPLCSEINTQAVIFNLGGASVFVEISVWNKLDLSTQAFTLIHEGFRFIQAMEVNGGQHQMTNLQLQKIVAGINLGAIQENLDKFIFIPLMDGSLKPIAEDPQLNLLTNSFISIRSAGSTLSWNLMLMKKYIFDEKESAFFLSAKRKKYAKFLAIFKGAIRSTIETDIGEGTKGLDPIAKAFTEINKLANH